MSTIARGAKAGGGTDFNSGQTIDPAEVNTDFNTIVTEINGGLDEDNISASANIPATALATPIAADLIDDHGDDASTYANTADPGDSGTLSLPTTLEGELERIRYQLASLRGYNSATYKNSSDVNGSTTWVEPPIVGQNLLVNASFEGGGTVSSGDPPFGWTEVNGAGGIASSGIEAADEVGAGVDKRSFQFTTTGAGDGISQTLSGLKASTKYLFGCTYKLAANNITIDTTGGLASPNNYQNPAFGDSTPGGLTSASVIVQTDTSGTDIVARILGNAAAANNINVYEAWFYELGDTARHDTPSIISQEATHNTADTPLPATWTAGGTFRWEEITELALSQYIPGPGYRLVFTVTLSTEALVTGVDQSYEHGFQVKMDGAVVDGPYLFKHKYTAGDDRRTYGNVITMTHDVEDLTEGSTYDFTVEVGGYDQTNHVQMTVNPVSGDATTQSVSISRLRVERI